MTSRNDQVTDWLHEPFEVRLTSVLEAVSVQRWLINSRRPDAPMIVRGQQGERLLLSGDRETIAAFLGRKHSQRAITDADYADAVLRLRRAR